MEKKINDKGWFIDEKSHEQEIINSRTGGFGGSDAELFYRIGIKGLSAITQRDKKRIRVAKGIDTYVPVMQTEAMTLGHKFEEWFADNYVHKIEISEIERERLLTSKLARNFDIFAHADFFTKDKNVVYELKSTSDMRNVAKNNEYQLQWYYMLGAHKVILVSHDSSIDFKDSEVRMIRIYKNYDTIETLKHGINLLDENWDKIDLTLSDELTEDDLMPYERREIDVMYKYLKDIELMEKEVEDKKKNILQMMRENNIKSIKSDRYNIAYVPAGMRSQLDSEKLFKDHPEINKSKYTKLTPRADYLNIKFK